MDPAHMEQMVKQINEQAAAEGKATLSIHKTLLRFGRKAKNWSARRSSKQVPGDRRGGLAAHSWT
jgi:hypothetical protein